MIITLFLDREPAYTRAMITEIRTIIHMSMMNIDKLVKVEFLAKATLNAEMIISTRAPPVTA